MRPRAGRVLVLLGWVWLGWHYFARLVRLGHSREVVPRLPGTEPIASFR